MKYTTPKMKVITEDKLQEVIQAYANSEFQIGGCVYYGALTNNDYLCSVGSLAGY